MQSGNTERAQFIQKRLYDTIIKSFFHLQEKVTVEDTKKEVKKLISWTLWAKLLAIFFNAFIRFNLFMEIIFTMLSLYDIIHVQIEFYVSLKAFLFLSELKESIIKFLEKTIN